MIAMGGTWTSKNRNLIANPKDNANISLVASWVLLGR